MLKHILVLLFSISSSFFYAQEPVFKEMDFLVGEWNFNAKSLLPDGTYRQQNFYSKVNIIHNGMAQRDDFFIKNQNGDWIIYGSTLRSYDAQSGYWKMLWYNYNLTFVTKMTGEFKDGVFHFNGEGSDQKGDYIERITFYEIEENQYKWKSDKSYDKGKTWMENYFSYTATRAK